MSHPGLSQNGYGALQGTSVPLEPLLATHKKGQHLQTKSFFGWIMVELRSPGLWGVQSDAEFHARFANEGPEVVRAQFRR